MICRLCYRHPCPWVLVLCCLAGPLSTHASDKETEPSAGIPLTPGPSEGDEAIKKAFAISWIQQRLDDETAHAQWWWYGWLAQNAAGTVASAAIAGATNDVDLREDMIVSSASALIGTFGILFFPLTAHHAAADLRHYRADPLTQDRDLQLRYAETLLRKSAEAEELGRSWLAHLSNVLIVGAGSAILAAFGNYGSAALNAGIGIPVGEILIWTQPTQAIEDWETYQRTIDPKSVP